MKFPTLPACGLALLLAAGSAAAQSSGGSTSLLIKGASDSRLSLPYQRPHTDAGTVSGVGAKTLKLQGKSWTIDQFSYNAGGQPETYYALFLDGPLQGVFYKILSNSPDTLVLDTEGDDLTAHPLGTIAFGNRVHVIPYWRVADVFGDTDATVLIDPRTSPLFAADDLLLYDNSASGVNKAPVRTLYYRANAGWRSVDSPLTSSADTIIPPGSVFTVRRRGAADLELVNFGVFHKVRRAVYVAGGGTTGNDQFVSLILPEPLTLTESGLGGGVVTSSPSQLIRADEVLLRRSPATGFNNATDTTLYYRQGFGWFKVGDSTPIGNTFMLSPGEAIIIRRKAGTAGTDWLQTPPP